MYKIKVLSHFSSAHNLLEYKGKCEKLHGHNWKVELSVSSRELMSDGMLMDFKDLKKLLNEVLEELDHGYLNDIEYFCDKNPTSENIARYIFNKVKDKLPEGLSPEVCVWETENSMASYSECSADRR